MNILALDPATKTGYAARVNGAVVSGVWNLKPKMLDSHGVRFLNLIAALDDLAGKHKLDLVAIEQPGHLKSAAARHLIHGVVSHVQSWAERRKIDLVSYEPTVVKKRIAGKGNANKDDMRRAALERYVCVPFVEDDNQADALCVLACAEEDYG